MAVAVTFGHSWASAVFYNFSVMKLEKQEVLEWDGVAYKKAWAERDKRQRVLSFDIHHDTCTILKKGKVERTEAISSLVAFTEDDTHATVLSLQFAPPDDPKKAKKFEEVVRLEVLNPFDRQIIKELMAHATETGSLEDLEDSFPKQTLHHSVLQLQEKSSFKTNYCVLVKWKLYIYEDWYSKHTASSLCLMGVEVEKDAKDSRKLVLHTSPVPTNIRCADEEERDFWYEMLYSAASMAMPGEEAEGPAGMEWGLFEELIEQIKANEADLDELDFTDSTWHLNEEQAFILAEALMTPNTVVKKLDLAMNQTLGDDGKVAISELLLDNLNCVETFTLAGCDLQDAGAEVFCEQMHSNTSCQSMDMSYNELTDDAIPALSSMLQANSTLAELDLTGNKFTKDGFSTFSKSLKDCSLKRLVLASMAPGDDGLSALADGLSANAALEELDLEEVEVSDASRAALTKLLEANKKVAITGVDPPIERPTAGPEPEPEPKPKPKPKKREKLKFDAQGNIIKEVTGTINHLGDKNLGEVGKGEGFLGVLAQWRDTEVLTERQDEMEEVDPRKRDELRARFEAEDAKKAQAKAGHGHGPAKVAEGVPPRAAKAKKNFGCEIGACEKTTTDDGQTLPRVLVFLKEKIGDASAPNIFLKKADASSLAIARKKLEREEYDCEPDQVTAAHLFLEWFGEYPSGVLAELPDATRKNIDSEEGALEALGCLDEAMQEAMTCLIDTAHMAVAQEKNGVGVEEMAARVAECMHPVETMDDGQLFVYLLLEYWGEAT